MKMHELPDEQGHFGRYGGVFVAETLVHALDDLRRAYEACRKDPDFVAEFEYELKHYVGRPSPVYHARRWSQRLGDRKSTRLNASHPIISYAVFCLKKKQAHAPRQSWDRTKQPTHTPTPHVR